MSTVTSGLRNDSPESVGDNIAGMGSFFLDPQGAARRLFHKWFWLGPVIVLSVLAVVAGLLIQPMLQHVMENAPIPPGANPEQYQHAMQVGVTVQRIFLYCAPLLVAGRLLLLSAILLALSSVLGINAKFRQLFNLVAGCGLIDGLSSLAGLIILKGKGEISSMAELRPALGLDIFLPEGTNKFLVGFLGYFTIFEIWWIVMMVLILSAAFRTSKGKAVSVVAPLVLLSLTFRLVATAFQRT